MKTLRILNTLELRNHNPGKDIDSSKKMKNNQTEPHNTNIEVKRVD